MCRSKLHLDVSSYSQDADFEEFWYLYISLPQTPTQNYTKLPVSLFRAFRVLRHSHLFNSIQIGTVWTDYKPPPGSAWNHVAKWPLLVGIPGNGRAPTQSVEWGGQHGMLPSWSKVIIMVLDILVIFAVLTFRSVQKHDVKVMIHDLHITCLYIWRWHSQPDSIQIISKGDNQTNQCYHIHE